MPTNPVDSESVTLDASESYSGTLEWTSTSGETGDWDAEVRSADDTAVQAVTVEAISGMAIEGTATDDGGTPIERGTVIAINDSQTTVEDITETDSNGDYLVDFPAGDEGHFAFQHDDGTVYTAPSKPFLNQSTLTQPVGTPFAWWPMDEGSGSTVADNEGTHDGAWNGSGWTSGTWIGDYALDGDGTDDYIDTTSWGTFGSQMDTDIAIAMTFQSSASNQYDRLCRVDNSADSMRLNLALNSSAGGGEVFFQIHDSSGNNTTVETSTGGFNDGSPHRVVFNKTANSASGFGIWVDNTDMSTSTVSDQGVGTVSDFDEIVPFMCRNNSGTIEDFHDVLLDDIVVYQTSLTSTEISDDYARQPWVA